MSDQPIFDDEELEELAELVRKNIADALAKRAKAEQEPKDFFDQKTAEWLNPEITDPDEEKESPGAQAERWLEMDRKPQVNTFGMPIETIDEVWNRARGINKFEEPEAQNKIADIFQRWMSELDD
jgi:hypothetical protein